MALHTLGTNATTSLPCLAGWQASPPITGGSPSPADVAAINASIVDDGNFGITLQGLSFGVQSVLTTGTTHGTTSLTSVAASGGSPPITQIQVGDVVLGIGVAPGTFVSVVAGGGATLTLSQATTSNTSGVRLAFVRLSGGAVGPEDTGGIVPMGLLYVPSRGILRVQPADVVAIDNTGWPILVSAQSIAYAGSQWTFT